MGKSTQRKKQGKRLTRSSKSISFAIVEDPHSEALSSDEEKPDFFGLIPEVVVESLRRKNPGDLHILTRAAKHGEGFFRRFMELDPCTKEQKLERDFFLGRVEILEELGSEDMEKWATPSKWISEVGRRAIKEAKAELLGDVLEAGKDSVESEMSVFREEDLVPVAVTFNFDEFAGKGDVFEQLVVRPVNEHAAASNLTEHEYSMAKTEPSNAQLVPVGFLDLENDSTKKNLQVEGDTELQIINISGNSGEFSAEEKLQERVTAVVTKDSIPDGVSVVSTTGEKVVAEFEVLETRKELVEPRVDTSQRNESISIGDAINMVVPNLDKGEHFGLRMQEEGSHSIAEPLPTENEPKSVPTQGNRHISEEVMTEFLKVAKDKYRFTKEEVAEVEEEWKATVIGVMIGGRVPFKELLHFMESNWNVKQPKMFYQENGVIIFKFSSVEDSQWVIKNGPWIIWGNRNLILKEWHNGMALNWSSFTSVPVWAKVLDIDPIFLSSKHMLRVIGNMIGKK